MGRKLTVEDMEQNPEMIINYAYKVSLGQVGNIEDANDIAQISYYRALVGLKNFNRSLDFSPWLSRIVTNASIDLIKQRQKDHQLVSQIPSSRLVNGLFSLVIDNSQRTPLEILQQREEALITLQRIDELPKIYQEPLYLSAIEGLSYNEISDKLDLPLGTVRSRINRARTELIKKAA